VVKLDAANYHTMLDNQKKDAVAKRLNAFA
jgi:hypothetical protein